MASYRNRRKYGGRSRRSRNGRSSVMRRAGGKKKKSDFGFFPFLCLAGIIVITIYVIFDKKEKTSSSPYLNKTPTALTVDERIKQKKADIQLQQDIQSQQVLSDKFKVPVEKVDPIEPLESEMSPLDMGVSFSDNATIESVFKELDEKPFENDVHQDPENVIRRQIAHRDWLEKHLKERNEEEKRDFIRRFIQTAREQGYNVYFTEDLRVILEPIDPEEEKKKKGDFEEVKINWK